MSKPITPVFAFERRMDIERECGFTLAGQLVVDTPCKHVHNKRSKQTIVNIIATLKRMAAAGPEGLSKAPHPFFGQLTADEWDKLQVKHLDHHFRQFGV